MKIGLENKTERKFRCDTQNSIIELADPQGNKRKNVA